MSGETEAYLTLERGLNLLSALGIGILSVPAFSLNFRKRQLDRIETIVGKRAERGEASALDDIATELRRGAERDLNQWRPIDQTCLRWGYFLLLGPAIVRVLFT